MQHKNNRTIEATVGGTDLQRLERAAKDMGITAEELLQRASDEAAAPLLVLPSRPKARVFTFSPKNQGGVND